MITEQEVLIFPDTVTLADFIIENGVHDVEVNSLAQSVTGNLSPHLINVACNQYNAYSERVLWFILDSKAQRN